MALGKYSLIRFGCLFILFLLMQNGKVTAQINGLKVETYYVADANDATDTTGGRSLVPGTKTYRIYVEVKPGTRIKKIYGDNYHPMRFTSTADFYNNVDRPASVFGYQIKSSWFSDNPLLALDSWLTLGLATSTQKGVVKDKDTDGDDIAGANNSGGTALIPGGLLVNTDPAAGVPLTTADGLMLNTVPLGQWTDIGFKDFSGNDTTVFGPDSIGNEFICYGCAIQQNTAVIGASVDSNSILVGQLTTAGDLSFQINITTEETDSLGNILVVNYVSSDDTLLAGEQVSSLLQYPPVCGCTDPKYLEYGASYACNNPDSCKTLIVFGCMDTLACNFDPEANVNISTLCCYPGLCDDRDISLACPSLNNGRFQFSDLLVYPNPTSGSITMEIYSKVRKGAKLIITDAFGRFVLDKDFTLDSDVTIRDFDISQLKDGIYFIHVFGNQLDKNIRIVKQGY